MNNPRSFELAIEITAFVHTYKGLYCDICDQLCKTLHACSHTLHAAKLAVNP